MIEVRIARFGFASRGNNPRNQNFLLSFSVSCRSLKYRVKKLFCQFLTVGHLKKMWMNDSSGWGGGIRQGAKGAGSVRISCKMRRPCVNT